MRLFVIFLLVPLIEIALFIQVGGFLGLWPTLLIVVLTALLGTVLVRSQGSAVLAQIKGTLDDLRDPTEPLAHGAMILFSGALLLTPGFFTDAIGFALLVPGIRASVFRYIRKRITVTQFDRTTHTRGRDPRESTVIDAEYVDLDASNKNEGPSGWTRH